MNYLIRIGLVLILGFKLGFCEELMVASYPIIDASLYINGKLAGETPLNLKVKPGKYKLKAEKEGWFGEEKEVIVGKGEEYVFVNVFMRREEKTPNIKSQESEIRAPEHQGLGAPEISKIEPEKPKEGLQKVVEPSKIAEISKTEPPTPEPPTPEPPKIEPIKIEVQKMEPEKPKEKPQSECEIEKSEIRIFSLAKARNPKSEIEKLILKASSLIESAEEEGAGRFAKKRLKKAKELLKKAKKGNSFELATLSISEAELALKETKEKISHYSSSYITGIFKNIGK